MAKARAKAARTTASAKPASTTARAAKPRAKPTAKPKTKPTAKPTTKPTTKPKPTAKASAAVTIVRALRAHALALPDTVEEFPWDHSVVKVAKKVIIFLERDDVVGDEVRFSVKLPDTGPMALALPFATPTGYGLGKAGWVSFAVHPDDAPPLAVMTAWIDESFCAVGPKRTVARWRATRAG